MVLFFLFFVLSPTVQAESSPPRFVSEGVELELQGGHKLQARIVRPEGQKAGETFQKNILGDAEFQSPVRLPALIILGGFEEAGKVLDLLHPREPILLASFDYPYGGSRKYQFPGTLLDAPKLRRSIHQTLEGIQALFLHLRQRSDVDPARIGILGASFGAPFALAGAAREPRFKTLILVHGFADVSGTLQHRLSQLWQHRLGFLTQPLAWLSSWGIVAALDLPRPEVDAARLSANQKIFVIEATEDHFIPPASRELLWTSILKSPAHAERLQMPGGHLMPGSEDLIQKITEQVMRWVVVDYTSQTAIFSGWRPSNDGKSISG